jgi:type 1 glutamine amidotransferase
LDRIVLVRSFLLLLLLFPATCFELFGLDFPAHAGPGKKKHIVLISGDEEYRSEEMLPQLARILSVKHGFYCTVLFAINPDNGNVDPARNNNIPGLEALQTADLMVLFTRWRDLPDEQMQHIVRYVESGKPIIGIRTATHAFMLKTSPTWQRWSSNSKDWDGGFGRQVLGETWISHHGVHGKESTKGLIVPGKETHPILRGIADGSIWGPTDVYTVRLPQAADVEPLVLGRVLRGMNPSDPPLEGAKNNPMMPVAWTRSHTGANGRKGRVFTTTMGSAQDFANEGFRRLLVNASYWALGLEKSIKPQSDVALIGNYAPSPFRFNGHKQGLKPEDFGH